MRLDRGVQNSCVNLNQRPFLPYHFELEFRVNVIAMGRFSRIVELEDRIEPPANLLLSEVASASVICASKWYDLNHSTRKFENYIENYQ